jgi:acyl-CoA synthetase (AMP-forming)/AMP-acid ligase II
VEGASTVTDWGRLDQLPLSTLSDLVAGHARFHPSRPAVITAAERLDWGTLDHRVTQVANGLRALGLDPGDKVALITANGAAMVEILLGINRAGGVMVPLSLLASGESLGRMIADCGARVLFVSAGFDQLIAPQRPSLPQLTHTIAVDWEGPGWPGYQAWRDRQSGDRPRVRVNLADECVIIYSSGTTGAPKGIVHTHYNRSQFALGVGLEFRFTAESVALVATPLYSNGTWLMFLPALITRAPLVIMGKFDPAAFLRLVPRERVTHAFMVPPQFLAILDHPDFAAADLRSLRLLASAGSTLRAEVKRRIVAEIGPVLLELYGLTEGIATVLLPEDVLRKPDSVGTPLFGGDIRIIDGAGQELPRGEVGEIVGYGSGLMKGYHNRPEATAETIWRAEDGRSYLKSGDIGRLDVDGYLYLVDRKKDMILSGGFNVYPRDIEEVLASHPDVADVTVIGIPDPKWDEVPLALVIPRSGSAPDRDDLKTWVNQRVGKAQRVARVELRDGFPRNALGKVLKRELRAEYGH